MPIYIDKMIFLYYNKFSVASLYCGGTLKMAEYYISYNEINNLIEECISLTENHEALEKYKAEILAALTGDFEQNDLKSVQEMIALWENQNIKPSQLLLGNRYILVQQSMIDLLKAIFTSGIVDAIIRYAMQGDLSGITVSVGMSITIALWDLLNNVKTLNDWDFCVYMQAVTHFKAHEWFSLEDLKCWMPTAGKPICNMHNNTWSCDYWNADDTCKIQEDQNLEAAISSLRDKDLLSISKENHQYVFKFKV